MFVCFGVIFVINFINIIIITIIIIISTIIIPGRQKAPDLQTERCRPGRRDMKPPWSVLAAESYSAHIFYGRAVGLKD